MVYALILTMIIMSSAIVFLYYERVKFNEWLEDGDEIISKRALNVRSVGKDELPEKLTQLFEKVFLEDDQTGHAIRLEEMGKARYGDKNEVFTFRSQSLVSLVKPAYSRLTKYRKGLISYTECERLCQEEGELQSRLWGAIKKVNETRGKLHEAHKKRYLARLPMYPEALRFNSSISWLEEKAGLRAIFRDGQRKDGVYFGLGRDGLISFCEVASLPTFQGSRIVLAHLRVEFEDYIEMQGALRPSKIRYFWLQDGQSQKFLTSTLVEAEDMATKTIIKE